MLKTIKAILLIAASAFMLCSCDNEPHYNPSYISRTDVQQKLMNGISGEYQGKLIAIMDDGLEHKVELEDGTYVRKTPRDSITNFWYTVGGYGTPTVTLHSFPHSWVANIITDNSLKELLKELPDADINMTYRITSWEGHDSHQGVIEYNVIPLEFVIKKEEAQHTVKVEYIYQSGYRIDADDESTWDVGKLDFDLSKIYVDGNEQKFEWNKTTFYVYVKGKRSVL